MTTFNYVSNVRFLRVKAKDRLEQDILQLKQLPVCFSAPPADCKRFDNLRKQLEKHGWYAFRPQDKRLTQEMREAIAEAYLALEGK